ncbi:hypothetical protein ABENE_20120 [Asticcacaulis benevestitus DSM 16100 = ATCC BAA-896]|uniref:RNA polymerase sigma factor 70 region 4 type 2 domain-containing protein n=2 Tax=Asticcacaulis TaxID=76890 RepID=V4PEL5_9CAUL|nr:hypothetical protein ABENE_20120 [Asticcacaulis benevestitus DSM 16100 = ATCC BAA-896]
MSEEWLAGYLQISEEQLCDLEEGRARITFEIQLELCRLLDVADRYFYMGFGKSAPPPPPEKKSWLRDVDLWFRDNVSPFENLFLKVARQMLGPSGSARDLVHDAYTQLMIDDRWRTVENPRAYLKIAVKNLAKNRLHRERIVPMLQLDLGSMPDLADIGPDAANSLVARDRLRRVLAALEKLPPQARKIMIMRKIDDLSAREIAGRLRLSLKTVEGHLARGMVLLNQHLEADENRYQLVGGAQAVPIKSSGSSAVD